jgi:death-on-curing protein
MILWIERALALAIHDRQLAEHGGVPGVRDENLLASALARPQQLLHYGEPPPDLADLAATLAFGMACNRPFVDGNKRAAYAVCRVFLALNGEELVAPAEDKYLSILAVAEGRMQVEEYAAWLRKHSVRDGPDQVQEPRPAYRRA